ncbi:hypothetical protein EMIT0P100_10822 [Pseudomonas sp. IT-P100]
MNLIEERGAKDSGPGRVLSVAVFGPFPPTTRSRERDQVGLSAVEETFTAAVNGPAYSRASHAPTGTAVFLI